VTGDISHAAGIPRDVGDSVMVRAIAYCAWAANVGVLVLAMIALTRMFGRIGHLSAIGVPLAALVVMTAAVLVLAWRPSRLTMISFVLVGIVALAVYQVSLLSVSPELQSDALYLLNRPALSLVLVGTASASALGAVGWGVVGFAAGAAVSTGVALSFGLPVLLGAGPGLTLVNYSAAFLGIALVQRARRSRMPDLAMLREETRRIEERRSVDRRSAALIHDTILNDLALVAHAPATLDERTRDRLRRDIHRVSHPAVADWPGTEPGGVSGAASGTRDVTADDPPARFADALMGLAEDFQWRGLSVDVVVDPAASIVLRPDASTAVFGALSAALENVLRHSGQDSAEIIVGTDADVVSLMVVDAGTGFDTSSVPADRLGIHASVRDRIESIGGTVRLWSTPGSGTSVLMSIPRTASEPLPSSTPHPSSGPPADVVTGGAVDD
jgi:signal transduction histidine kinase